MTDALRTVLQLALVAAGLDGAGRMAVAWWFETSR